MNGLPCGVKHILQMPMGQSLVFHSFLLYISGIADFEDF